MEVVVGDDVAVALGHLLEQVACGMLGVVAAHLPEVVVCLEYGTSISPVELDYCHAPCQRVEQSACKQGAFCVFLG